MFYQAREQRLRPILWLCAATYTCITTQTYNTSFAAIKYNSIEQIYIKTESGLFITVLLFQRETCHIASTDPPIQRHCWYIFVLLIPTLNTTLVNKTKHLRVWEIPTLKISDGRAERGKQVISLHCSSRCANPKRPKPAVYYISLIPHYMTCPALNWFGPHL